MKKLFFYAIFLMVFMTFVSIPRLQAEDGRGCGATSLPIYGENEGKTGFPILCFEALGPEQMKAVRGKFSSGAALPGMESVEDRGRIILWDESKAVSIPQINCSYDNNQSYSVLTAINYR